MFGQALFWFVLCLMFSFLEIEIEGKHGWAKKLPTWRSRRGIVACVFSRVMQGKPLTGYHKFLFIIFLMIFCIPLVYAPEFRTWSGMFTIPSMFLSWAIMEDFLWFVFNPHYTIAHFRQDRVEWHKDDYWVGGLVPLGYFMAVSISVSFAASAGLCEESYRPLVAHFTTLFYWAIFIIIASVLSPLYHERYWKKRRRPLVPEVQI